MYSPSVKNQQNTLRRKLNLAEGSTRTEYEVDPTLTLVCIDSDNNVIVRPLP